MRIDSKSSIGQAVSHNLRCKGRFPFARQETIRLILLVAFSLGTVLNVESSREREKSYTNLPVTHDLRPKFALFSWTNQSGSRRFALVSNRGGNEEDRFIDRFSIARTKGIDIGALEHELTRLPTRCLVTWIKDEPHKLDYAEVPLVRRLKKVATRLHLDLQFNEMTYESTGVE